MNWGELFKDVNKLADKWDARVGSQQFPTKDGKGKILQITLSIRLENDDLKQAI